MRRSHRRTSLKLVCTAVLCLAATAGSRDSSQSFLQQGIKLFDHGHFVDSVAALTRALEQNPKDIRACCYRAQANEMVDRQAAIGDWRRFAELAAMDPRSQGAVTLAQERLQALAKMPRVPDSLCPFRYVPKAGDYYEGVAVASAGLLWTHFPVKVYADSPPEKWQRVLREALAEWNDVLPLRQVSTREEADIIISWASLPGGRAGTERSFTLVGNEDDRAFQRLGTASIVLDNSHRWSGPQTRFDLLHEMGHALGINGHSKGSKDIMIPILHETIAEAPAVLAGAAYPPAGPMQFPGDGASAHINMKLTLRDVNTLIRLYNCSGPVVHLK